MELSTFHGEWCDSLGNDVKVWDIGRGCQVSLSKPNAGGKEILLVIKKFRDSYECGHYEMDENESYPTKIVWRDKRWRDRITVWTRRAKYEDVAKTPASHMAYHDSDGRPRELQARLPRPLGVPEAPPPPAEGLAGRSSTQGVTWMPPAYKQPPPGSGPAAWRPDSFVARPPPIRPALLRPNEHQPLAPQGMVSPPWGVGAVETPRPPLAQATRSPPGASDWPNTPLENTASVDDIVSALTRKPEPTPGAPEAEDWSHVLNVLEATSRGPVGVVPVSGGDPGAAAAPPAPPAPGSPLSDLTDAPSEVQDGDGDDNALDALLNEEARWSEVLDLLAVASGTAKDGDGGSTPGAGGQIHELFSPFGLVRPVATPEPPPSESVRERVLEETLARLLREKQGEPRGEPRESVGPQTVPSPFHEGGAASPAGAAAAAAGGPPQAGPDFAAPADGAGAGATGEPDVPPEALWEDVPDWARGTKETSRFLAPAAPAPKVQEEAPLSKFIRIFGLDELAAKCLRKLEDDEAAFVIESCQGRLKHAANPSAVVMIAIRNVAAHVGRRYWGSRQNSDLDSLLAAAGMGNRIDSGRPEPRLEVFAGSPSSPARPSPPGEPEVLDDDEEQAEEDGVEVVDLEPQCKRIRRTVEVVGGTELEASPDPDDAEEDEDGLFFVDTEGD